MSTDSETCTEKPSMGFSTNIINMQMGFSVGGMRGCATASGRGLIVLPLICCFGTCS